MINACIKIGPAKVGSDLEKLEDIAFGYLGSLLRNWQVLAHLEPSRCGDQLCLLVSLPRRDSLQVDNHDSYGLADLQKISEVTGANPVVELLDDSSPEEKSGIVDEKCCVLYTHFLDVHSPLVGLTSGQPIAIHTLPLDYDVRQSLAVWADNYRHIDSVWMSADGPLSLAAYKEMASPKSPLSKEGRELCQRIESVLGVRVFFYLFKNWGTMDEEGNERVRLCPLCGANWQVRALEGLPTWARARGFLDFAYQCTPCGLVANEANNLENAKLAKYGEWKEKRPSDS